MRSPFPDHAVHHADHDDDAEIGVVPAVDQHGLEGRVAVALRRGKLGDDGLQHVGNAEAGLGADRNGFGRVDADHVLDLRLDLIGFGGGQVDLVEDRHDLMIRVDGLVDIGEGLRLDALCRVDDQQRAFDRAHAPRDLIAEIDMAGRVDEVQDVLLAVLRRVFDPDGLRLDGDAAFPLDIHAVEHLGLHVAFGDGARELDQPVGQRGFAVVDMRHDGEVTDLCKLGHDCGDMRGFWRAVNGGRISAYTLGGRHRRL